jgi:hypothetical protein
MASAASERRVLAAGADLDALIAVVRFLPGNLSRCLTTPRPDRSGCFAATAARSGTTSRPVSGCPARARAHAARSRVSSAGPTTRSGEAATTSLTIRSVRRGSVRPNATPRAPVPKTQRRVAPRTPGTEARRARSPRSIVLVRIAITTSGDAPVLNHAIEHDSRRFVRGDRKHRKRAPRAVSNIV